MSDPLRQELLSMEDFERFAALTWVLDHHADVFSGAARYVRRLRALEASTVRKEARP